MMTLKEKFKEKILSFLGDNMKEQNANQCEKIADEFAIEFAEWVDENAYWLATKRINELLELFKKEKGL
jgi:hypothetical protein